MLISSILFIFVTTKECFALYLQSIMKRLVKLSFIVLALLMPTTAFAAGVFEADGICYSIDCDTATVVTGRFPYSGHMTIPKAVIHDGKTCPVTAIGQSAFRDCFELKSITIPSSIQIIGEQAFTGCTSLDSVDIDDLRNWCDIYFSSPTANPCHQAHRLFLRGEEIVDLVIPDSASVSSFAFTGCRGIQSVTIPASVTTIGLSAFNDCGSLAAITVDSCNVVYDSRDGCNAIIKTATGRLIAGCQNTVIPEGVTAIGDWAFSGCTGLTSIFIPASATEIGYEAFYRCSSLMGVNIPNSIKTIGYQAFYGCTSLQGIHIPASVRGIASSAFEYCPSLSTMSVASGNTRYDSRDDCNAIIETAENILIAGCRNTVIPPTVTAIEDYAFSGCSTLASADIPIGVTSVGDYAYRGCSSLRRATIPQGVTSIGASAFFECTALQHVEIPASVESIGAFAFERCPAVLSMSVESGNPTYDSRDSCNAIIETATNTLIAGCMNTVIPQSVTSIGDNAFGGCFMLTKVQIPKSVTRIGHYAFTGCTSLSSIDIPNTVTFIGDAAFSGCSALSALDIPNSVTSLGEAVFVGCISLQSVRLPNSVTTIGDNEFLGCTMLKDINLHQSMTAIGYEAFRGCLSLESVNIPKSVTRIGNSAFRECPSLSSMTVARGNPNYDSRNGCNAIIETSTGTLIAGCRNTSIPNSVTAIGYAAFDGCVLLNSITIPSAVIAIGRKAFNNCPGLKEVICLITDPTLVATSLDAFRLPLEQYSDRTLHVPAGSTTVYQNLPPWSEQFGHILEFAPHSPK